MYQQPLNAARHHDFVIRRKLRTMEIQLPSIHERPGSYSTLSSKAVKTRRYTPITSIAYQDRQARSSHQRSSSWSSISGPPRCSVLRCRLRCSRAPTM